MKKLFAVEQERQAYPSCRYRWNQYGPAIYIRKSSAVAAAKNLLLQGAREVRVVSYEASVEVFRQRRSRR